MPPAADPSSSVCSDAQLRTRYQSVKDRIVEAAARSGRRPDEVMLVAVSKMASPAQIIALADLGQRDFAENRVQNLVERVDAVAAAPVGASLRWHLIGTLQRNKARRAIELARLIHSIDNLRVAESVHEESAKRDRSVDILIKVNISGEVTKHGMNPRAVPAVIEQMQSMAGVEIRGLMTMAPASEDAEASRPVFENCRELFDEIQRSGVAGPSFNILSMGMSSDFEVAIECGANIVRVGSAIFGP